MKRAFTVEEVIITLFIIATVATMTIPAIQKELKTNEPQVKQRMQFKNRTHEKKINFMSAYFCWNFLPKQICISNFKSRNQMRLF